MNFTLAGSVMKARDQAKVPLPLLFASAEEARADPLKQKFNCTQKSALNYTDNMPNFCISALVAGVSFPLTVAPAIVVWVGARYYYHHGYSTGVPEKRIVGSYIATLTQYATFAGALVSAVLILM